MHRFAGSALALGLLLSLAGVGAATAHEGSGEEEIVVEPAEVTAGDTVIVVGSGLEPDDERILALAGADLVVDFGTVSTDAEGMFQAEVTIPAHLPSGVYELRAIGDEIVTAQLTVTAAAGGTDESPAPDEVGETIVPRDRTPIELALVLALVALAGAVGGLLVWRAERVQGSAGG